MEATEWNSRRWYRRAEACGGSKKQPVPRAVIEEIIGIAKRAPSSMNTQPWHVHVLTGAPLEKVRRRNMEEMIAGATPNRRALFLDGGRDRVADLVDLGDDVDDVLDRGDGLVAGRLDRRDLLGDFGGGLGGLAGQRFDFGSDDRKAAAGLAGAGGLDGGVQRQKVGLGGDVLDQRHDVADLLRAVGERTRGIAGAAGILDRARGDLRWTGNLAADLGDRGSQFLGGARHRLHVGRGLFEAVATTAAWRLVADAVEDIDCAVSSITDDAADSPPTSS